jgi:O-antigen/teichoic acid export membrane protein
MNRIYFFLRLISVILDIAYGVLYTLVFSQIFPQNDFAFLTILFGYVVYFSLGDLGFSKAFYYEIRKNFIENRDVENLIAKALGFYSVLSLILGLFFLLVLLILLAKFETNISFFSLFVFGIGQILNIQFSFVKSIFNAISDFVFFETMELFRKLFQIFSVMLLFVDQSFYSTSIFYLICLSILILFVLDRMQNKLNFKIWHLAFNNISLEYYLEIWRISKASFLFSIAEIVIYNGGYLILPILLNTNFGIIQYGIWMKIFAAMSVFIRIISDVNMPELTKKYFEKLNDELLKVLNKTYILSFIVLIFILVLWTTFDKFIFNIWLGEIYQFDGISTVALFVMLIGNSLQHSSGTFLMSIGQFSFLRTTSLFLVTFITITTIIVLYFINELNYYLLSFAVSYFIGSILYFKRTLNVVKLYEA